MPRASRLAKAVGGALKSKQIIISHEDLTAAALTQQFAMGGLPDGAVVDSYDVDVIEAFVGVTTLVLDLGDAGGSEYANDIDMKTLGRSSLKVAVANSDGNGVAVTALFTATVDNVVAATAGKVAIRLMYSTPSQVIPE